MVVWFNFFWAGIFDLDWVLMLKYNSTREARESVALVNDFLLHLNTCMDMVTYYNTQSASSIIPDRNNAKANKYVRVPGAPFLCRFNGFDAIYIFWNIDAYIKNDKLSLKISKIVK